MNVNLSYPNILLLEPSLRLGGHNHSNLSLVLRRGITGKSP